MDKVLKIRNPQIIKFLEKYRNVNFGANQCIERYIWLYRFGIGELRKKFSEPELKYIIDLFNGHIITEIDTKPEILKIAILDGDQLDGMGKKWNIEVEKLIKKISSLNSWTCLILSEWANEFWYGKNQGKDLEKYIKELLS